MFRRIAWLPLAAFGSIISPLAAWAQQPQENTIAVVASENVRLQPTLLRLEVQIRAKAETAEKAVKVLKGRRAEALAKLKELKAEPGSIHIKNTVLVRNASPTYYTVPGQPAPAPGVPFGPPMMPAPAQPIMPVPQLEQPSAPPTYGPPSAPAPTTTYRVPSDDPPRNASDAPSPSAPSAAPAVVVPSDLAPSGDAGEGGEDSITAATELRAEWRLRSSDPDAIALAAESLREKLAGAKLFGKPEANGPVYPGTEAPGFRLHYVGVIDAARRKAAIAAALAKAKDRASDMAEAAGCQLGKISSVTCDADNGMLSVPTVIYNGGTNGWRVDDGEAVSSSPNLPEIALRISAQYRMVQTQPQNERK